MTTAHSDVNDYNDLEQRLRALGSQPVDSSLQSEHLTEMSYVKPATTLAHKVRVAGALVAGIFIGSTGLAFAGALPDQAQDVAHEALAKVNLEVPTGTERVNDESCMGFDGVPFNRGQFLKHVRETQPENLEAAKQSKCGMPVGAEAEDVSTEVEAENEADEDRAGHAGCVADDRKGQGKGRGDQAKANKGKPDTTGQPEFTGKPDCTPDGGDEAGTTETETESESDEEGHGNRPATTPGDENRAPQSLDNGVGVDEAGSQRAGASEGHVPEETPAGPPSDVPPDDAGESGAGTD